MEADLGLHPLFVRSSTRIQDIHKGKRNMSPSLDEKPAGKGHGDVSRRDFIKGGVVGGAVAAGSMGAFYFGYGAAEGNPVRVGVLGTGDEGNVLLGAINPEYVEVKAIADIRPYNVWRAFNGDQKALGPRKGLMSVYGWETEAEARRNVKVYGAYQELLDNAKADGIEAGDHRSAAPPARPGGDRRDETRACTC